MKARKPDGSRWFTPTTSELMDRWLADPQLLDWLRSAIEVRAGDLSMREIVQLVDALMAQLIPSDPQTLLRRVRHEVQISDWLRTSPNRKSRRKRKHLRGPP